jgi:hypothetical protein
MERSPIISLLYAAAAGFILILVLAVGQFADLDLWGRLSMGALIEQTGRFPYYDVFSYIAPHAPWTDHEWLSGLVFYWILVHLGEPAFLCFKYLLIAGTLTLLFDFHRRSEKFPASYSFFLFLLLVPIIAIGYYATIRAQIFSLFFYVLFLWLLELVRIQQRSPRWLLSLIPLGALWGNLHGGFILGVLLCLAYSVGEAIQQRNVKAGLPFLGSSMGISLLLTIANPYGVKYWPFLLHAWTLDRKFISEWHPLTLNSFDFIEIKSLVFIACLILAISTFKWVRKHTERSTSTDSLSTILVLLLSILMVFKALRFAPFLGLTLWMVLPSMLPVSILSRFQPLPVKGQFNSKINWQMMAPIGVAILAIFGLYYLNPTTPVFRVVVPDALTMSSDTDPYPVEAMKYLRESPYSGNLMTGLDIGEFVYWNLYPKFKIGMDGRFEEVYQKEQFHQNYKFYAGNNPEKISQFLDSTRTDFILTREHFPHVQILTKTPDWTIIYQQSSYWVLARTSVLKKFPAFKPQRLFITNKILTLSDFIQPTELQRFKAEAP